MATHGSMIVFNPTEDDCPTYVERVQHIFANGFTHDGQKASILLTLRGNTTYKLLRSLALNNKLESISSTTLICLLQGDYNLKPFMIVQRYLFNIHTWKPEETIASKVAAIRDLASHYLCEDKLPDMLRDCLVYDVNHKCIQW